MIFEGQRFFCRIVLYRNNFAVFIENIFQIIEKEIKANGGLLDKFTGDGALAFFLQSMSDTSYINKAVDVSKKIIKETENIFNKNIELFSKIPELYGIGIGIDSGDAIAVLLNSDLTFIGEPVINACRVCCNSLNNIMINNQAFIGLNNKEKYTTEEKVIDFKHEGKYIVHNLT